MSNRGEQKLLKQSTVLMFAVAIAGIVTGFMSGSQSILFDGFFSLIATFIKVLMLITAQLIAKESNQRFQFGFWHLEPMVLLIEGSFLVMNGLNIIRFWRMQRKGIDPFKVEKKVQSQG